MGKKKVGDRAPRRWGLSPTFVVEKRGVSVRSGFNHSVDGTEIDGKQKSVDDDVV